MLPHEHAAGCTTSKGAASYIQPRFGAILFVFMRVDLQICCLAAPLLYAPCSPESRLKRSTDISKTAYKHRLKVTPAACSLAVFACPGKLAFHGQFCVCTMLYTNDDEFLNRGKRCEGRQSLPLLREPAAAARSIHHWPNADTGAARPIFLLFWSAHTFNEPATCCPTPREGLHFSHNCIS